MKMPTFEVKLMSFKSEKEMMDFMNSKEGMQPFLDYAERVEEEAARDLSPEDKEIYLALMRNKMPQRKDGKELSEWNPAVYNAVMWSISMGLG